MILDTNALSAFLTRDPDIDLVLGGTNQHHLPVVVLGEFQYGLLRSRHKQRFAAGLASLISDWIVLDVTLSTCTHYADIREELRADATPISPNDVWIAAIAREYGLEVASKDTDFDRVRGLVRRTW